MTTVFESPPNRTVYLRELQQKRRQLAKDELSRYYDDPVAFAHDCIDWKEGEGLAEYQEEYLSALVDHNRVCVRSLHGVGKAQPHGLVIDTPAGPRKFGDLAPGDLVFGVDGRPIKVKAVYERGEMEVYRVRFNDGTETLCSDDHLWTVRRFRYATDIPRTEWETLSLREIMDRGLTRPNGKRQARRWAIPTAAPLQFPYRWVPVDPYTLGAWLGDGTGRTPQVSGRDREVVDRIRAAGYSVREREERTCLSWYVYGLRDALRRAGVFGCGSREKFVPDAYLQNVPEVREEVLRGLLDTDGTVTAEGAISFCSTSERLAADVAWLARSLGGMARVHRRENQNGPFWIVQLTMPGGRWFHIERKQARVRPTSQKRYLSRWIDKVELVGVEPVRCIEVDAADGLYVANDAIVTHNTMGEALAVLWFAITRDAAGRDWKCPVTAGSWSQLRLYMWPEIHKWARKLRWEKLHREPFNAREILTTQISLNFGQAFAVASAIPAYIEGVHADSVLYIFDESKSIPVATWDAAEGAFTGAAGTEAMALACSTPGEPLGRFYDIQSRKTGYEDWYPVHIGLQRALDAGRVSPAWAEQRKLQFGENSALYANRVLGNFHTADEDALIPLAWIEAAIERWKATQIRMVEEGLPMQPLSRVGVDVAAEGEDATVISLVHANRVDEVRIHHGLPITETSGKVLGILQGSLTAEAVIDCDGLGVGVKHTLAEEGMADRLISFHAQTPTDRKDRSGELGFDGAKAEAWWMLREALDPEYGPVLELPENPTLMGDLSAPHWTTNKKAQIVIEKKVDVKKRLGRSPDAGDSVVMALWIGTRPRRKRRMVAAGRAA